VNGLNDQNRVSPRVGEGLEVNLFRNERLDRTRTELGMKNIGGVRFPDIANNHFFDSRFTASDINPIAVLGGITFQAH
jgi:hypothetical protein